MKKGNIFWIIFSSFLYLEIIFKLLIHNSIFSLSLIPLILFLISLSLVLTFICRLTNYWNFNKFILIFLVMLITIWFSAQYVVRSYFDFYITISSFQIADQLSDFVHQGLIEVAKRLVGILLLFIPLILIIIFRKNLNFRKLDFGHFFITFSMAIGFYGMFLAFLTFHKEGNHSLYDLYYNIDEINLNVENFGVIHSFLIDAKRTIWDFNPKIYDINEYSENSKDKDEEEVKKYEYNNLDIDFNKLASLESDTTIKSIHEYFSNETGTLKNEYTNIFKDKNLILFMAESFNEIAVSKELTPTLYKLINNGFTFTNFYTPAIYSTIGGEFQELTSLYAESISVLSKFRSGNISFPQGIAYKFQENNYKTFAYHDNSYNFQDRNKYLRSLGFTNFTACGNGLEKLINCKTWPQSDVEMIDATFDNYIDEDKFMVFYATVSGHEPYVWANASAKKHQEEYFSYGLDYSEGPSSYLASQMELDRALELLIKKLEEKGKLDDTVIALVGDHYPYELSISEINEISPYAREEKVTVNKSNFILWNNKMKNVKVDKVGSQLDVIPTIYNTFGINYDSRLLIGKDILSDCEGLAMFADRSWVTDKGTYYASTHKFIPNKGVEYDDNYVKRINQIVNNKIAISKLIIDNNYYSKVFK